MRKFYDICTIYYSLGLSNRIDGVMVSVLTSSEIDCGLEPDKTKDYEIGVCCVSTKHTTLRRKGRNWLTLNQDTLSEWGDMSICRLLSQWA